MQDAQWGQQLGYEAHTHGLANFDGSFFAKEQNVFSNKSNVRKNSFSCVSVIGAVILTKFSHQLGGSRAEILVLTTERITPWCSFCCRSRWRRAGDLFPGPRAHCRQPLTGSWIWILLLISFISPFLSFIHVWLKKKTKKEKKCENNV